MSAKDLLKRNGLVLSEIDKGKCQQYQEQTAHVLSRFDVDYATVARVVETLLDAGRLMGAEQAVRRHEEHERLEEEKVREWTKANAKRVKIEDRNN